VPLPDHERKETLRLLKKSVYLWYNKIYTIIINYLLQILIFNYYIFKFTELCFWNADYQEYVNELNMMPIKTDTLRAQRRKIEIEKQLNKLEEGIKVFSRPKVYVKINA